MYHNQNEDALKSFIEQKKPDLIVVFSMSRLLRKDILQIPKFGAINLHTSYLPYYRGPNPDFWQYVDMVMNPGVTIHFIDENEDTGKIINRGRIKIDLGTKSPDRLDALLLEVGVPLLLKSIDEIESGTCNLITQPKVSPTPRARNIKPDEHKLIIDWQNWPIEKVWHVLRGTELWLNAIEQPSGIYKWQRWVIGNFNKFDCENTLAGTVMTKGKKKYIVTRDGNICVYISYNFKRTISGILNTLLH